MRFSPFAPAVAVILMAASAFAQAPPATADQDSAARLAQLRQRAEALRAALAGDVCANQDQARALLAGGGTTAAPAASPQNLPAASPQNPPAASPQNPPAASPQNLPAAPAQGDAAPLSRKELAARLHQAVVLVIAEKATGSGFFVTPDTVITNNHVVESSPDGDVVVVGQGLGAPRPARVVARTKTQGQNKRDYAILKISGAPVSTVLPLHLDAVELTDVVAAGFPGLLLDTDMNFRALIRGDMTAMPELAMSQGAIMAIQNRDRGLPVIAHSAPISGGNSGGPLVDACGRVIGINTFVNVAVQQASSAGFALASKDLGDYLRANGVSPAISAGGCGSK